MVAPANCVRRILVLKADRYYLRAIERSAKEVFPGAAIRLATRIAEAAAILGESTVDLLLTGVGMVDGDVLDHLAEWTQEPRKVRRVLVVTGRREHNVVLTLNRLPIDGVFDPSTDEPEKFESALSRIALGGVYWSQSALEALQNQDHPLIAACSTLTASEELALAVLGDGCDNAIAAASLGLKESAVRSLREALHRKLRVQHKGELVRMAAELGYVCISKGGVIRPGFARLLAARRWRTTRLATDPSRLPRPV